MSSLQIVDMRSPGYGIQLQFRSEEPLSLKAFRDCFDQVAKESRVNTWEKHGYQYISHEFLTENQDFILNFSLAVASRLGVGLEIA